jgi:phospholipid-binding lipoprotein MlaA
MSFHQLRITALIWALAGALVAPLMAEPDGTEMEEWSEDEEDIYGEYGVPQISDPFEPINRSIHKFNATTIKFVIRPVAQGYETVVPSPARRGLTSFFENLRYPVRLVSNLLQGDIQRSFQETEKFLINTTIGVGGFIKVSDRYPDLRIPDEDIGQALGKWGIPRGPYIVVPVLGPYTLRDGFGGVGDFYLTPMNWGFVDKLDAEPRVGVFVLDKVVMFPEVVAIWDTANRAALDPYIAVRNGYIEHREAEIDR